MVSTMKLAFEKLNALINLIIISRKGLCFNPIEVRTQRTRR